MMYKKIIFATLTVLILFSACEREDNLTLLTKGNWKLTAATDGGNDVFNVLPICTKDNVYAFGSTGDLTVDEGATKCNAADLQTTTLKWAFSGDQKQITTTTTTTTVTTFDIVQLNATTLQWSRTVNNKLVVSTYTKG